MSRKSQTELAVLGALAAEPATGYGVRQAIVETLGHFWAESFGQIYPTLAALERDGLVVKDAQGKYRVTARGRRRLTELLSEPSAPTQPRNGLLLRLFFAAHLPPGRAEALLVAAREEARQALGRYEAIEAALGAESHPSRADWLATVRFGIHHARATLAWCEETLAARAAASTAAESTGAGRKGRARRRASDAG